MSSPPVLTMVGNHAADSLPNQRGRMINTVTTRFSLTDYVVVAGVIAYIVSLAKDWRPIRTLRAENRELRLMLATATDRIKELEQKIVLLQNATDLTLILEEQHRTADLLLRLVEKLEHPQPALTPGIATA